MNNRLLALVMFAKSFMRAAIIGLHEGAQVAGPLATNKAVYESFLKVVGAAGKTKDAHLYVSPDAAEAVAFVGLGPADSPARAENIRQAAAKGYSLLKGLKPESVQVDTMGNARAAAEGITLASYSFNLKTADKEESSIKLIPSEASAEWELGVKAAESQNFARRLSDTPANHMTPRLFCATVQEEIARRGLSDKIKATIYDESMIDSMKMGCFIGVAKGSAEPARLLVLEYNQPKEGGSFDLAFVGKGVTFDAGGVCLKPSKGMGDMKHDMGGAASVVSALIGAAATNSPKSIVAVTPLCENLVSSKAQKPGDVVTSMSGLTVEIEDTDAEGRLILADALHFVQDRFKPSSIVDVATLTGAMCVAVGPFASGIYATNDSFWGRLHQASENSGDRAWRMPLWEEYDELLRSEIADLKNLGLRDGGANSAARFLQRFVKEGQEWAHIDMAPVMTSSSYYGAKNRATGRPVRLLLDLAHQ